MRCAWGPLLILSIFSTVMPARTASSQSRPYSIDDVIAFVKGGVPAASILSKAKTSCITFRLTPDVAERLQAAGAGDALIAGLVSACYKGETTPVVVAPPRQRRVPPRVVVKHDTVVIADTVRVVSPPTIVVSPPVSVVPPAPVIPEPVRVVVPEGTDISVALARSLSSKDATLGDRVKMVVDSNVVVNGNVAIARGTPVRAEIAEVKRAGRMGKGGRLSLRLLGTSTVDGQEVSIRATKGSSGADNMSSTIALTALFGVFGLFRHGDDMVYKEGTRFPVFTDATIKVTIPAR